MQKLERTMLLLNDSDNCQLVERVLQCWFSQTEKKIGTNSIIQPWTTNSYYSNSFRRRNLWPDIPWFWTNSQKFKINICTNRRGLLSVKGFPFFLSILFLGKAANSSHSTLDISPVFLHLVQKCSEFTEKIMSVHFCFFQSIFVTPVPNKASRISREA